MPTVSNPDYRDLIGMANITGLAMIMCNSSVFPSTSVIWKKDNITIREDNTAYQATQRVTSRSSSTYVNTLVIHDILGILGKFTYTCTISNSIGEVSRNIQVTKTGIKNLYHAI